VRPKNNRSVPPSRKTGKLPTGTPSVFCARRSKAFEFLNVSNQLGANAPREAADTWNVASVAWEALRIRIAGEIIGLVRGIVRAVYRVPSTGLDGFPKDIPQTGQYDVDYVI
jgi:hypothetical protein